jgi:hypothetical protein
MISCERFVYVLRNGISDLEVDAMLVDIEGIAERVGESDMEVVSPNVGRGDAAKVVGASRSQLERVRDVFAQAVRREEIGIGTNEGTGAMGVQTNALDRTQPEVAKTSFDTEVEDGGRAHGLMIEQGEGGYNCTRRKD